MKRVLIMVLVGSFMAYGCVDREPDKVSGKLSQEQLADINRQLVTKERERIESYIERKGMSLHCTQSGLWYSILKPGSGENPGPGDVVVLDYVCSLLDGTECYSSTRDGVLEVEPGRSSLVTGLDEGVRLLTKGAEAIFIIPSYLGFGLTGDRKRIPSNAVLVYRVKVVDIK